MVAWQACLDEHEPAELYIQGHSFPIRRRSDDFEENLEQAALTLEDLRVASIPTYFVELHNIKSWQAWLLFVLPSVAAYYEVASGDIFRAWAIQQGLTVIRDEIEKASK